MKLISLIFIFHLIMTALVANKFLGSTLYLALFSLSFCALLILSLKSSDCLSMLFLGVMLWLGFWLKFIAHQLASYAYGEAIGRFTASPEQWNQVLLIASLAAFGFNLSFLSKRKKEVVSPIHPGNKNTKLLNTSTIALFVAISCTAFFNLYYGVTLSGISAITILPFKLNAITGWFLYVGFTLTVALLAKYEFASTRAIWRATFLTLYESLVCSTALISRGLLLFHALPFLYIVVRNYHQFKFKVWMLAALVLVFAGLFVANSFMVGSLRYTLYGVRAQYNVQNYSPSVVLEANTYAKTSHYAFAQIGQLVVDRWIGLEGVMATSTYPDKSFDLLTSTFLNKLKIGETDIYAKIAMSDYRDNPSYSFTTLPGIVAFLLYSNSLIFVFIMMLAIGIVLSQIDWLMIKIFHNPFLSAQVSFILANGIAQFGISPRPLFISFGMMATFLVGVKLLSTVSDRFGKQGFGL